MAAHRSGRAGTSILTLLLALVALLVPASAQAASPVPPNITNVQAGDSQATVTFSVDPDAPADATYTVTATPVLSYVDDPFHLVYIRNGTPVVAPAATRSPVVVGGLTNGISYAFAVTASNIPAPVATLPDPNQPPPLLVSVPIGIPSTISGTPPPALLGADYSFHFTLDGLPAPQTIVSTGSLPPGLTLDRTGNLSGTPTTTGGYAFTVAADNGVRRWFESVTLDVVSRPGAPSIVEVRPGVGTADVAFTTSGTDPVGTTYTAVATPDGGKAVRGASVSGSPATVAGLTNGVSYRFTVEASTLPGTAIATATSGASAAVVIGADPTIDGTPPDLAYPGSPFRYAYTLGGAPAPVASVTAGALPPGLSLSPEGVLSGTPTAGGRYVFTVTATNALGSASTSGSLTLTAPPQAPRIDSVAAGDSSAVVSFTPGALGYPAAASYYVVATPSSGSAVTTLSSAGSPITVAGLTNGSSYRFVVVAVGVVGSATSEMSASVTVGIAPTIVGVPPAGAVGAAYSYGYALDGSPAPTTAVTAGSLPPGLSLVDGGVLSGAPTAAGSYTFTVSATNALGSSSVSTTLVVAEAAAAKADVAVTLAAPSSTKSRTYSYQLTVKNQGPQDASKVVALLTVPRGVSIESASGSPVRKGRTLVWPVTATLRQGQVSTYTVGVRVSGIGPKTAAAAAGSLQTPDPAYRNNVESATTVVTS